MLKFRQILIGIFLYYRIIVTEKNTYIQIGSWIGLLAHFFISLGIAYILRLLINK